MRADMLRWGEHYWTIDNSWDDNVWFFTIGYIFYALGQKRTGWSCASMGASSVPVFPRVVGGARWRLVASLRLHSTFTRSVAFSAQYNSACARMMAWMDCSL